MERRTLLKSFMYAFSGCRELFRTQPNIRIHTAIAAATILLSVWLQLSRVEWALILVCIVGVWCAEAFNSSLEKWTDIASPEFSREAKLAKDIGAAAVLVVSLGAVFVGLLILGPLLFRRLSAFF